MRIVPSTIHGLIVLLAVHLGDPAAQAQSGSRTIMRQLPDGTHEVLMLTAPDYPALRTPDFSGRDLDLMKRKLLLSDEQASAIGKLIERYLNAFRAITKELASATAPQAEFIPESEDRSKAPGSNVPDNEQHLRLDDLDLPRSASVSYGTSISTSRSDDPDVPAPPPVVKVTVMIDDLEGEELAPELIEAIRKRADDMAARMVERLMAEEEARQAGVEPAKPVIETDRSFDLIKAEHDALIARVEEFLKAKGRLREQFVLEAQAGLADTQIGRWPSLERALYRQRSLPKGQLAGESMDLALLLDSLELTEAQLESLASQLEAYEVVLDAALRQRDALLDTASAKIDEAIANRKPDLALSLTDRVTSLRRAVRNANRTALDELAAALPPHSGQALRQAALKACYPRVYIETRGKRMFATIRKMDGLDEQVKAALIELEASYDVELANINEQLRGTIDREGPLAARRGIEHLKDSIEGKESQAMSREDPYRALIMKRAELDDRYLKLASDLVGPERAATLPKPRASREPVRIESATGS